MANIFTILCIHHFIQLIHSTSIILLLVSSSIFSISVTVFFITDSLLSSFSRLLLNVFYILSILFSRFWIAFTTISLNSFSGELSSSSSFIWSCKFLPCSFICNIFIYLLILSNLLYLRFSFYSLQGSNSLCFWHLISVGEIGSVACVGSWWEGQEPVFWWFKQDLFPLKCRSISEGVFWGVCGFVSSLSAEWCVCTPVLLVDSMEVLALRLQIVGGSRSGSWDGEFWEGFHRLKLSVAWNFLVFQCLDSVLPPQRLRLDPWPGNQMLQAAQLGKKGEKEDKYGIKTNKQNPWKIAKTKISKQQWLQTKETNNTPEKW